MDRLSTVRVLVALAATTACQDQEAGPVGPEGTVAESSAASSRSSVSTYRVTVTNETRGQPFTPPLAVTHSRGLSVFKVGEAASPGVQEIAENGNLAVLEAALAGDVFDLVIAAGSPPPYPSGDFAFVYDHGGQASQVFLVRFDADLHE